MKKVFLLTAVLLAVAGCNTTDTKASNDTRACAQNFTFDGSFVAGRTFKTNEVIKGVSKNTAIQRATAFIISEGMQITSTDRTSGIISASQVVSYSRNGAGAPYTVLITPAQGGVKVTTTFKLSGGLTANVNTVRSFMCSTMSSIKG